MAQQVVIKDRFRIICEADAEHMGALLAQMTRMGLENIGYELITDIRTFNKNAPRVVHEKSADELFQEFLKDHPSFLSKDVTTFFKAADRPSTAAYPVIGAAVKAGFIVKVGPASYARSDVKAIAPPAPAKGNAAPAKEKSRRGGAAPRHEVSNKEFIWNAVKNRKHFKMEEVIALFNQEGRLPKSISPQISVMAKEKLIKVTGIGTYDVTPNAKAIWAKAMAAKGQKAPTSTDAKKIADKNRAQERRDRLKAEQLAAEAPQTSMNGPTERDNANG